MFNPVIFVVPVAAQNALCSPRPSAGILVDGRWAASDARPGAGFVPTEGAALLLNASTFLALDPTVAANAPLFVEYHPGLDAPSAADFRAGLAQRDARGKLTLVTGDLEFAVSLLGEVGAPDALALKSAEAGGAASTETAGVLLDHALRRLGPQALPLGLWGGIATPEAAAAFLATGASFVIVEHAHWLTESLGLDPTVADRLRGLKQESSSVVDASPGLQWRFFDKGNSQAVRELRKLTAVTGAGMLQAEAAQIVRVQARGLAASSLSATELTCLGVDAAFAAGFVERFGAQLGPALERFAEQTLALWAQAPQTFRKFLEGPASGELGVRFPFIQGAMSWISDSLDFAKAVAEAGALPTLAVGMRTPEQMDRDFAPAATVMGDLPYAMNVLVLDENPRRDGQLAWMEAHKPPFVAVAAGSPVFAAGLRAKGHEVIYLAADIGLLRMAAKADIRFIVLEGCEAGGHVGRQTSLALAQAALELRRTEPELMKDVRLVLAGGICDGAGTLRAAMLGADAVQMGTVYLGAREIVSTGALSALYQQEILAAGAACTRITGESVGLRVRALDTPKVCAICALEREKAAGIKAEDVFRHELEAMSTGSLLIAAKGVRIPGGAALPAEVCRAEGQFMSGAVAGNVSSVRTLEQIHATLASARPAAAPASDVTLPAAVSVATPVGAGCRERIAVTGMAMANSLGNDTIGIIEASLAGKTGIGTVPKQRWDHSVYHRPNQVRSGFSYTDVGAFMELQCTRKDLGVSPQDFRTMSYSTRLTLLLARRAIEESGLAVRVPGARVAVLTSQNSAEAASTIRPVVYHVHADDLGEIAWRSAALSAEQRAAIVRGMRESGMDVDDTTLIGRLNCTASGHVCNMYGFGGPSYSVGAACASSLIALYNAVQLVRVGIIDAAVVGGGEELLTPVHYCEFSALRALAGVSAKAWTPSQHSRPFDRDRGGFVLGEGGAVVVIERESVARAQGAPIHAFITGVGACTNHQGIVESVAQSQLVALRAAKDDTCYSLGEVDLVECHGTSTVQGDREEVRALKTMFPDKGGHTVLASFKSQIGHTLGASGISSMIRGIGAMRRGLFPPTLNYENSDPSIGLEVAGFRVLSAPTPWPAPQGRPRRMQVNAFGFGGACVVIHLEGPDNEPDIPCDLPQGGAVAPAAAPGVSFHTAWIDGRGYRVGINGPVDLAKDLLAAQATEGLSATALARLARKGVFATPIDEDSVSAVPLALIFSGQGLFYQGMGRALARRHPVIERELARLCACADYDLRQLLFEANEATLRDTRWQQPALFALEYALSRQLMDLGLAPQAVAGHSLGEFSALCAAGVLTPEDAFRMVDKRAQLMDKAARTAAMPGAMAAVALPVDILEWKLAKFPGLCITNYNGPKQVVVGGEAGAVASLVENLKAQNHRATLLKVSMAFHSPVMRVIRDEFSAFVSTVEFRPPAIPVVSNVAKGPFPADPAAIRAIMVEHLETPVHWMQNVYYLWSELGIRRFVEVGPGDVLSGLVADICEDAQTLSTAAKDDEATVFGSCLATLYAQGALTPAEQPGVLDLAPAAPSAPSGPATAGLAPSGEAAGGVSVDHLEGVIRIIMEATGYERDEIEPDMDIRQDLAIRSSRLPVIMEQAEQTFGIELRIEDFVGVQTVRELAACISGRVAEAKPGVAVNGAIVTGVAIGEAMTATARSANAVATASGNAVQVGHGETIDHLEGIIRIIMDATGYERDEIEPDMDIRQDLAIRSSRLPVIMEQAEQTFGIELRIEDFVGVQTVRQLAERISERAAEASSGVAVTGVARGEVMSGEVRGGEVETDTGGFQPVARYHAEDAHCALSPCALPEGLEGKTLLVANPAGEGVSALADALAEGLGMRPATADVARHLDKEAKPAGLLLTAKSRQVSAANLDALLAQTFARLKEFVTSPERKFCVVLVEDAPHGEPLRLYFEGVLGMLLTLAQEYKAVRCLCLRVAEGVDAAQALLAALAQQGPVERLVRAGAVLTPQFLPGPLPGQLPGEGSMTVRPGDVVVASGGAKGVTARLLECFAPLGVRLVLLGRGAEGRIERKTMERLRRLGAQTEYRPCDVADAKAVSRVLADVAKVHGRIDGFIHGAGFLRDKFLAMMTGGEFADIMAVKLGGLRNLTAGAGPGLRFAVAFSSVAAWHGNVGQANYCCGNRAMASFLAGFARAGVAVKTFWLPPVGGVGMASGSEIRQLMDRKGMGHAYVEIDELAALFTREILAFDAVAPYVLFARRMIGAVTVAPLAQPTGEAEAGRMLGVANAPMLDAARLTSLSPVAAVCARQVSHQRDLWLPDHRPFKSLPAPIFSAVMVVETFFEAARTIAPHLMPVGMENLRLIDMLPCAPGMTRNVRISVGLTEPDGPQLRAEVRFESEDISPKGRALGRWTTNYEGRVVLAGQREPLSPLPGFDAHAPLAGGALSGPEVLAIYESNTGQTGRYRMVGKLLGATPDRIAATMTYRISQDVAGTAVPFAYSPYLLEALMQLVFMQRFVCGGAERVQPLPVGIDRLAVARCCADGEALRLVACLREDNLGHQLWDACGFGAGDELLMRVEGLAMRFIDRK